MLAKHRPRLTYANVMSTFAAFAALGGGAYAATQLPASSVGTKQLKKDAVVSLKIKNGTIVGADINKSKLGKVPLATRADVAGNAAKLGGLEPSAFLRSNGKAVDAAHADSADSAGDANTVGGKGPSDFVGATQLAGGDLSGPFSNLALGGDSVTAANVVNDSLTQLQIHGVQLSTQARHDLDLTDNNPLTATRQIGPFTLTESCLGKSSTSATTGSITISDTGDFPSDTWDMDSHASNGAIDQTGLAVNAVKNLIVVGPATAPHMMEGDFGAMPAGVVDAISGHVAVRVNYSGVGDCQFQYAIFGSSG